MLASDCDGGQQREREREAAGHKHTHNRQCTYCTNHMTIYVGHMTVHIGHVLVCVGGHVKVYVCWVSYRILV